MATLCKAWFLGHSAKVDIQVTFLDKRYVTFSPFRYFADLYMGFLTLYSFQFHSFKVIGSFSLFKNFFLLIYLKNHDQIIQVFMF